VCEEDDPCCPECPGERSSPWVFSGAGDEDVEEGDGGEAGEGEGEWVKGVCDGADGQCEDGGRVGDCEAARGCRAGCGAVGLLVIWLMWEYPRRCARSCVVRLGRGWRVLCGHGCHVEGDLGDWVERLVQHAELLGGEHGGRVLARHF
jgi:hypothetical protein